MSHLVFVDDVACAHWLTSQPWVREGAKIVASFPTVAEALEAGGLEGIPQESFIDGAEYRRRGMDHYATVERFCRDLDRELLAAQVALPEGAQAPIFWHYYSFKVLFDSIFPRAWELLSALEKEKPDTVTVFESSRETISDCGFLHAGQTVNGDILDLVAKKMGIKTFQRLPRAGVPAPTAAPLPWRLKLLQSPAVRWAWTLRRVFGLRGLWRALAVSQQKERPYVLTLNAEYDILFILRELFRRQSLDAVLWEPIQGVAPRALSGSGDGLDLMTPNAESAAALRQSLMAFFKSVEKRETFRSYFRVGDHDLYPVFERVFAHFFGQTLPRSLEVFAQARGLFSRRPPRMVLTFGLSDGRDMAVFDAARAAKIPRVIHCHGPNGMPPTQMPFFFDYVRTDYYVGWGEGVREDVERFTPHPEVKVVGSSVLDSLARGLPSNRSAILKKHGIPRKHRYGIYVLFPLFENVRLIDSNQAVQSFQLYEQEKAILQAFQKFPDVHFILKLFPHALYPDPLLAWLSRHRMSNVTAIKWTPFVQLLPLADVVVSDYYDTPTLQTLAAGKPLLVFSKDYPLPASMRDLEDAAFVAKDAAEFEKQLGDALIRGTRKSSAATQAFTRRFGTYLGDGRSTERAANALEAIALGPVHRNGDAS